MDDPLTRRVIGAAIEVHRHLGPGLLESAYEECFCYELSLRGIAFQRQLPQPIIYKGLKLDCAYRLDVLVEDAVIVELKAVEEVLPVHSSQLLSYLKASDKRVGLLINFNVPVLKNGIKRIANDYVDAAITHSPSDLSVFSDSETSPTTAEMTEGATAQKNSAFSSVSQRLCGKDTASTHAAPPLGNEETATTQRHRCSSAS